MLDLGSGGGIDVLLSARRVGPTGKAYGLDMTDEMLALALENKEKAGATNVEFLKGHIEAIPLPSKTVDVIISNCVINLSGDKRKVLAEAFRVLKPGGRFAVSDVVVRGGLPDAVKASMPLWTGCVAGALEEKEFIALLDRRRASRTPSIEPTRVYTRDDAAALLAGTGLDVALADAGRGKDHERVRSRDEAGQRRAERAKPLPADESAPSATAGATRLLHLTIEENRMTTTSTTGAAPSGRATRDDLPAIERLLIDVGAAHGRRRRHRPRTSGRLHRRRGATDRATRRRRRTRGLLRQRTAPLRRGACPSGAATALGRELVRAHRDATPSRAGFARCTCSRRRPSTTSRASDSSASSAARYRRRSPRRWSSSRRARRRRP